ncbi:MAG: tetratricopeptide repeat protein [Catenulispora sp.]|nr:tetratricopeptide repeat protein [Catenulispora sp.]
MRVRDLSDPAIVGVHPAAESSSGARSEAGPPPFVKRDTTDLLHDVIRAGSGFVLIVGESTAGKTRAAFEAVRELLPAYKFVFPANGAALARLVPQICLNHRVLVWLDDLELYLTADGPSDGMVQRMLCAPQHRILIVATMANGAHARYSPRTIGVEGDPPHDAVRNGREIVKLARVIRLDRIWTPAEIGRAQALARDPRLAAAIRHAHTGNGGVAEYLAAAPELLNDWLDGRGKGAHPRGAALVDAAVDARRAGYHHPLPVALLRELHEGYLERSGGAALNPEPWEQALAWAEEPLRATSSLLRARESDTYMSFDYLHDALDARAPAPRIPEETWRILIDFVDASGAFDIGTTAMARDDLTHAIVALDKAAAHGDQRARRAYAYCVCEAGDPQRAVQLYAALVIESELAHGPTADATLLDRYWYARCLGLAGRPDEAVTLLDGVITERTRTLGPFHELTMATRNSHAYHVGLVGDPQRAIRLYRDLLAERLQHFKVDHPHTLNARFGLAFFTGEAGRPDLAAEQFEQLVADRERLQGRYKRHTLNNRRHHAHFLGEAGHAARAADLFEVLVSDCLAALDPGHPDTMASRYGQARFVGEAGDPDSAVRLLTQLLDEERDDLGHSSESPIHLLHRRYHAHFVCEAGRPQEAARLLRLLVADARSLLGRRHPITLHCRISLARAIGMSGSYGQAVEMYQVLTDDCTRILGEDHPLTLSARNGYARFLGDSGKADEAAACFELVCLDRTRVLGPSHPHTLNSRNGHAHFVGRAGDHARAARLLRKILADRTALFGAEHPWTSKTAAELEALPTKE